MQHTIGLSQFMTCGMWQGATFILPESGGVEMADGYTRCIPAALQRAFFLIMALQWLLMAGADLLIAHADWHEHFNFEGKSGWLQPLEGLSGARLPPQEHAQDH